VDRAIRDRLVPLGLTEEEAAEVRDMGAMVAAEWTKRREGYARAMNLRIENLDGRMSRLMDVFLDGAVERPAFEDKKLALLMERKELDEERHRLEQHEGGVAAKMTEYLELVKTLQLGYEMGNPDEKRNLLKSITSNFTVDGKNIAIELRSPFREIENLSNVRCGAPLRGRPRTFTQKLFKLLIEYFSSRTDEETTDEDAVAA